MSKVYSIAAGKSAQDARVFLVRAGDTGAAQKMVKQHIAQQTSNMAAMVTSVKEAVDPSLHAGGVTELAGNAKKKEMQQHAAAMTAKK